MPRKTNYRLDYDEGYDDDYDAYHDYDGSDDCEHGPDTKEDGKASQQDKAFKKPVLWSCSICTYENDESYLSCEICGVLREPSVASTKADEAKDQDLPDAIDSLLPQEATSAGQSPARVASPALTEVLSSPSNRDLSDAINFLPLQTVIPIVTGTSLSKASQLALSDSSATQYNPGQLGDYRSKLSEERQLDYSSNSLAKERQLTQIKGNNIGVNNGTSQTLANDLDSLNLESQLNQTKGDNTRFNKGAPRTLANDLDSLKLEKHFTRRKCDSQDDYKPEKGIFHDQEQEIHDQLNLAIVGHVDSGKSTLSGRLLHLLGRISKKEMHKYEKEAKVMGKGSFAYAWTMDESAEERERGVTMTVAVAYFDSKKYRVVLLDSPGHKDFVPNMISGATQADGAVLVVDASVGSFEAGMDGHGFGQTREHAQLIRSFGVEQLIVAINKMDLVDYDKERFNFIKMQLGSFLRSCGFKETSITWIPLSVMENQNLVTAASDVRLSSWYRGLSILDAIDSLQAPPRDVSKPLRLPICDVTKLHTTGQVAVSGKLEAGAVRNGSKVLVMPSGYLATVRSIERDSSACNTARAGDNVAISLLGIDPINLMQGGVLCHPDFPVAMAKKLELKILVLDITMPIIVGSHVEFHIHHAKEAARVAKIISLLDQKTGKVSKTAPRVLKSKQSAIVEVDLDGAVCVEEFSRCRALGRAFLRSSGNTIAVGIVTRVFEQKA